MIRSIMQTVGQFITDNAARMAPFERLRVGRVGCTVALIAIGLALIAILGGFWDTEGSFAAGFRYVVLSGLGAALTLFLFYALVETMTERSVRRGIEQFISESGEDLETMVRAAEMRREQIKGGHRMAAILKEFAAQRQPGRA